MVSAPIDCTDLIRVFMMLRLTELQFISALIREVPSREPRALLL